jgi:hypothetical protein
MTNDPVQAALQVLEAHGVLRSRLGLVRVVEAITEALEAAEAAQILAQQCDEPDCQRVATCGFFSQERNAYRRTCGPHSPFFPEIRPPQGA